MDGTGTQYLDDALWEFPTTFGQPMAVAAGDFADGAGVDLVVADSDSSPSRVGALWDVDATVPLAFDATFLDDVPGQATGHSAAVADQIGRAHV